MKKVLVLLFVIMAHFACVYSQVPTDGMVASYPFNGNANDESTGIPQNGTVHGVTLTTDRFGNANSAYLFTASSSNYIEIPVDSFLLNNYTYSVWVSVSSQPADNNYYSILTIGSGPGGIDAGDQSLNYINNYYSLSGFEGMSYTPDGYHGAKVVFGELAGLNVWVHVVITRDNNYLRLFINGSFIRKGKLYDCGVMYDTTGNMNGALPFYSTLTNKRTLVGARTDLLNQRAYFHGKIDDICIYNRALSATEVLQLYNAQSCIAIIKQPSAQSVNSGTASGFAVHATSDSSLAYKWQLSSGSDFSDIIDDCIYSGTNTDTLAINIVPLAWNNNQYRCIVSTSNCADTSDVAALTIKESTIPVYDTLDVYDTVVVLIQDTIDVYDTLTVFTYDTIHVAVTDTLIIDVKLSSVPSATWNTIKVYPNPALDKLYINNGNYSAMSNYSIKINNAIGSQMFQNELYQQEFEIDVSQWESGTYVLILKDQNSHIVDVRKIIKR